MSELKEKFIKRVRELLKPRAVVGVKIDSNSVTLTSSGKIAVYWSKDKPKKLHVSPRLETRKESVYKVCAAALKHIPPGEFQIPRVRSKNVRETQRFITFEDDVYDWLMKDNSVRNGVPHALSSKVNACLRRVMLEQAKEVTILHEFRGYLESQELHLDMFAGSLANQIGTFLDSRKAK